MNNTPVIDGYGSLLATTTEYWTVQWKATEDEAAAGIVWPTYVLNHYAYNIGTGAGTMRLPASVGDNFSRANRAGRRWRAKVPDQAQQTLNMWVRGSYEDDRFDSPFDSRRQFMANWEKLKMIFGQYDRQLLITKRIELPDEQLLVLSATGELAGTMDLSPQGDAAGTFPVDLIFADPYWYWPDETTDPVAPFWYSGGRTYPRVYPLTYGTGGGSSGLVLAQVSGTQRTSPLATLQGNFQGQIILQNTLLNKTLSLTPDIDLNVNDEVVVDFENRTVKWNGVDRYFWKDRGSEWWDLYPGEQRLFVRDSGSTPSTAQATFSWKPRSL